VESRTDRDGESAAPIDPLSIEAWAEVAEAIGATTKRLEKLMHLQTYLAALDEASLAIAARFFSGIVFPRHDARTTQVGGTTSTSAAWAKSDL